MINDMQYTLASEEVNNTEGVNMPLYNQDNGVSLIDLMYEDYNSEKSFFKDEKMYFKCFITIQSPKLE